MSLRERMIAAHPEFPWLEAGDAVGIGRVLEELGWLKPGERISSANPAGAGNMNLTLRVQTSERCFILKQARPWVEKYPDIAAPWGRSRLEQLFYERIAGVSAVATRMPEIFGRSEEACLLAMEDLPGAKDLSSLYGAVDPGTTQAHGFADRLTDLEIDELAAYLGALHSETLGPPDSALANREMRALNHEHIFVVPFDRDNGLCFEELEPGLTVHARSLSSDAALRSVISDTGRRYLADGRHLVHGDFFPGSWLRTDDGLRIIDPEFAHQGTAELDLACAIAHLAFVAHFASAAHSAPPEHPAPAAHSAPPEHPAPAAHSAPPAHSSHTTYSVPAAYSAPAVRPGAAAARLLAAYVCLPNVPRLDATLLSRFAAIEVMRRLIGVAQLPIPSSRGERAVLLERARRSALEGEWSLLFEPKT